MRAEAARTLGPVLQKKRSLQIATLDRPEDQALYSELCYGTLRMQPRLDILLDELLTRGLKAREASLRALLLIGLYQLDYMRIPDHAALDQTVAATRALGKNWARSLTNAVLRNARRRSEELNAKLAHRPEFDHVHPAWLCQKFQQSWPDAFPSIVEANNQRPPMYLRINQQRISSSDFLQKLTDAGIPHARGNCYRDAVRLETPRSIDQVPGFYGGLCSVQDEAAQLCANLLGLKPRHRVLDACAAPGGKAAHLLETCPQVSLTALDISKQRLTDVTANMERLGLRATILAEDAAQVARWWNREPFDRILIDAPCSGSGVIRRHPDIKILRQPGDIPGFCEQQKRLLDNLWPLLRGGGLLLYVTCSIMPEENEDQIAALIHRQPDAVSVSIKATWGRGLVYGRQLLPEAEGPDGFYFALLQKKPAG